MQARPVDRVVGFNKMPGLDVHFAADPCYEDKAQRCAIPLYRLSGRYRHFAAYERAVFAPDSRTEILMISAAAAAVREALRDRRRFHLPHPASRGIGGRQPTPGKSVPPSAPSSASAPTIPPHYQIGSGFKTRGWIAHLPPSRLCLKNCGARGSLPSVPTSRRCSGAWRYRSASASASDILQGRDDIPRFLLGADLLVHPAYNENTGTVLLEAVVAGLPVPTTAVCGYALHPRCRRGRRAARAFRAGSTERALARMLGDDAARRQWQASALAFAGRPTSTITPKSLPTSFLRNGHERRTDPCRTFRTLWAAQDPSSLSGAGGKVYRELEARRTLRIEVAGRGYFVKIHRGVGWGEILKNLLTLRAPVLGAGNENAGDPAAGGTRRRHDVRCCLRARATATGSAAFIHRHRGLAPTVSLEDFCRDWPQRPPEPRLKRALIGRVATMARRMHEGGVNHRDFYICHFLLHLDPVPDVRHVQAVADRPAPGADRAHTPRRWRDKDLASLYFSALQIGLTRRDFPCASCVFASTGRCARSCARLA